MSPPSRLLIPGLVIVLAAVGCGGDSADPDPEPRSGSGGGPKPAEQRPPLIEAGDQVVYIGDSLGIGGTAPFPSLLPGLLADRAPGVTVTNLGANGITTADWVPGSERFEGSLRPALEAGADVVLVGLGGNDLEQALGGADGPDALAGSSLADLIEGAKAARDSIARNLRLTFAAIHRASPDAVVVYVSYPDYSRAEAWRQSGPERALILRIGLENLTTAARESGPDLVVDMLDQPRRAGPIDELLIDGEHLSDAGHALFARRIARALLR